MVMRQRRKSSNNAFIFHKFIISTIIEIIKNGFALLSWRTAAATENRRVPIKVYSLFELARVYVRGSLNHALGPEIVFIGLDNLGAHDIAGFHIAFAVEKDIPVDLRSVPL